MFPDFMCIGAQRAGTSWLGHHLRQHPDVLIRKKEIHYFDRETVFNRPLRERFRSRRYRKLFARALKRHLGRREWPALAWDLRFYLGARNDRWYASLFDKPEGLIAGDLTPAYSALDLPTVQHIASLMPRVKVILLLRDPVDRAYSAARMHLTKSEVRKDAGVEKGCEFSVEDYIAFCDQPWVRRRGDYLAMLANWRHCFPHEQLFIGFLEDIRLRPSEFLAEVCRFLDISHWTESLCVRQRPVNAGDNPAIPRELAQYLARSYLQDERTLLGAVSENERHRGYVEGWIRHAESVLADGEAA